MRNCNRGKAWRSLSGMVLAAGLVGGCDAQRPDPKAERQALMQASRDWSKAAAAGKVDAIMSYWGDDAVVMMPGLPTYRGKQAIRDYVVQSLKMPGFSISWEPLEAHVSASGDMGYVLERTRITMPDPSGSLVTHHARAVSVWRRPEGGAWKNVVDISNADPEARPGS